MSRPSATGVCAGRSSRLFSSATAAAAWSGSMLAKGMSCVISSYMTIAHE